MIVKNAEKPTKNGDKKIRKVLCFFWGFLAGVGLLWILDFAYVVYKMPPYEKQLCRVKGYNKLNRANREDIGALADTYDIGSVMFGLVEEGMEINGDMEEADRLDKKIWEKSEVLEFTDLFNVSFDGEAYEAKEIRLCGRDRYEKLGVSPKDVITMGRKDVIEVYFEKKGERMDGFTIIINANGNMYFVPPEYLRTDKDGQVYWIANDIYIKRENED